MSKKHKVSGTVIPTGESKAMRFVRVVRPRVIKAVKAIDIIGYCASSSYEYTPKQVEQISATLFAALNNLVDSFAKKKSKQDEFNFDE